MAREGTEKFEDTTDDELGGSSTTPATKSQQAADAILSAIGELVDAGSDRVAFVEACIKHVPNLDRDGVSRIREELYENSPDGIQPVGGGGNLGFARYIYTRLTSKSDVSPINPEEKRTTPLTPEEVKTQLSQILAETKVQLAIDEYIASGTTSGEPAQKFLSEVAQHLPNANPEHPYDFPPVDPLSEDLTPVQAATGMMETLQASVTEGNFNQTVQQFKVLSALKDYSTSAAQTDDQQTFFDIAVSNRLGLAAIKEAQVGGEFVAKVIEAAAVREKDTPLALRTRLKETATETGLRFHDQIDSALDLTINGRRDPENNAIKDIVTAFNIRGVRIPEREIALRDEPSADLRDAVSRGDVYDIRAALKEGLKTAGSATASPTDVPKQPGDVVVDYSAGVSGR